MARKNEDQRFIQYLELMNAKQARRISELEAGLLYVLNLKTNRSNPDTVYIQATTILHRDFSYSPETTTKYKELVNGN